MEKIKVLIVDDHAIMREGVRALLGLCQDIEISGEASNGEEVVSCFASLAPDIVLMDIAMPGMDGLEATRQIKRKNKNIKILILTQHSNREYILSAVKAGADGYVPKGALSSELVSAIHAVHKGESFLHPSVAAALIDEYRHQESGDPFDTLSARERQVLKMLADGNTYLEIAGMLFISLKTVMGHRTKIMEKLEIHNRTELIKYAVRKGLTSVES